MQAMVPQAQQALIAEQAGRRKALRDKISELTQQRSGYLKKRVAKAADAVGSLDHKIYSAVRKQAGEKGLHYEADAPDY